MIQEAIVKIVNKKDLTYDEAYAVMNEIMSGQTSATQNAAFLAALSTKSARAETTDEIAGCAAAMRDHATRVDTGMDVFEIVGTGGDNAHSFNISTTSALVAAAGADAISVLTEPKWFLGSDRHLAQIAEAVRVPCLRKDFTVDDYMIYEAKALGAAAVLLICAIMRPGQLAQAIGTCDALGLSALVEAHDEDEVAMAVDAGARVIGVNNRNLKDFSVDTGNSARLRAMIPEGVIFVSESGVRDAEDVRRLRQIGADAVLIGEALMRAADRRAMLAKLRGTP